MYKSTFHQICEVLFSIGMDIAFILHVNCMNTFMEIEKKCLQKAPKDRDMLIAALTGDNIFLAML